MTLSYLSFNRINFPWVLVVSCLLAGASVVRCAEAQSVITWEQPASTTSTGDIRATAGNNEALYALNGGDTLSIAGIEFFGGTFDNLPPGMTFSPSAGLSADTAQAGLSESSGSAAYDSLLNNMAYTTSGLESGVIEFSGLNIGTEYQIQLWFSDQRSSGNNRSMIFGDDGTSNGEVSLAADTGNFGENVVGSFVATAQSQRLSMRTSGFRNIHFNALVLSSVVPVPQEPIDPIAGPNWIIDSADEWAVAVDQDNSAFQVADGFATSLTDNSVFQSRIQAFTTKQTFQQMVIHQTKEWPADQWKGPSVVDPSIYDDNDIGPSNSSTGDRDAPVFLSPQEGDYWVFDRSGDNRYHGFHSTDMINWVDKGRIGNDPEENGFRWVTTAEYHDGRIFIYTDRPNDHDPSVVTIDYVAGSGVVLDTSGNPTDSSSDIIAINDFGVVLGKPEVTIDGTTYSLAGGSDNTVFRDPADGQFHMIHEDWSHHNAQRYRWDSNIAGHAVSPDGINGFVFGEAPRPIFLPGNYITQEEATDTNSFTQLNGNVETVELDGIEYFVGYHPERFHLFRLTDQLHAWGDYSMIKVGETYYLFVDDDSPSEGIGLGYWYGDSLNEEFTYGGRIVDGVHPDPGAGFAEGNFLMMIQGNDNDEIFGNDLLSSGPWVEGIEAQAGVDVDGDGLIDEWTPWQPVSEEYSRIEGFTKAYGVEEAMLDMSSLPAGYGVSFRLRSESGNVAFDNIEISSVPELIEILLGDIDQNGVVNFLDISPFIGLLSSGQFQAEADTNEDGVVNFLDISPFITILSQ